MTFFRVRELEGPAPARLTLTGAAAALAGPELSTEAKGGRHLPLGSAEAILTTTGLDPGQTEVSFVWSASTLTPGDVEAQGLDVVARPESLLAAFETLAARGRACAVDLPGDIGQRGLVRKVAPKLGRGYRTDPASGDARAGLQIECVVTFDWSGRGEAEGAPQAFPTGEELAGSVGDGLDTLASAAADGDAFAPPFLEQLDDAVSNVRAAGTQMRLALRGLGAIAQAPARLALSVAAAARSFGNVLSDLDTLVSDTPDLYQAAGTSMDDVARGRAASGAVKGAAFDLMATLAALFDALDARAPRRVPVRPGQSLALVASAELGDRNRWPEIAEANGLGGQLVPDGVFSVEMPQGA